MEFEQDHNAESPEIDEATRRAANNKRLVLEPVHEDVAPEDSDGQVVASHITSAPIANIPIDEEATPSLAVEAPTQSGKNIHKVALASSITVVMALIAVTAIAFKIVSN